jgi:hypothetical protein
MVVDEFLPTYDVSDAVASVVDADVAATWDALLEADLIEVGRRRPLAGFFNVLRALPDITSKLVHGKSLLKPPDRMRLKDMTEMTLGEGGWVLLGERPHDEIALGLVGKFWRPVIPFARVSADEFTDFARPGWAKTVFSLSVRGLEQGTLLSGVMRTATTDGHARRWFRRYWTLGVGSGAHVLVNGLLELVKERAETKVARSR